MTEFQRLFLVQARTDFTVFELLRGRPDLPECHALHYLQMATELLGKAHAWKNGPRVSTHRAFVGFLRSLRTNRKAQSQLGFEGKNDNWKHLIRKSVPLAERIVSVSEPFLSTTIMHGRAEDSQIDFQAGLGFFLAPLDLGSTPAWAIPGKSFDNHELTSPEHDFAVNRSFAPRLRDTSSPPPGPPG